MVETRTRRGRYTSLADFAARLNKAASAGAFDRIVVIAPPQTLGELRAHYGAEMKKRLLAEIDRDLTKHPLADIETQVAAAVVVFPTPPLPV